MVIWLLMIALFAFDGFIRVLEYWSEIPNLRFYKEAFFSVWILLSVFTAWHAGRTSAFPIHLFRLIFAFIVTVFIGILFSLNKYHGGDLSVPLWGLKTSFFYVFLIPILFWNRKDINSIVIGTFGIVVIANVLNIAFAIVQAVGGYNLLEYLLFPTDTFVSTGGQIFRPMGCLRSAHEFGTFSLLGACFLFPFSKQSIQYRMLFWISVLGVFVSTSKSAITSLPIMFLYFYLIEKNRFALIQKLKYFFPVLLFSALSAFVPILAFFGFLEIDLRSGFIIGSSIERLHLWTDITGDWFSNFDILALLFGRGYGYYGVGYQAKFANGAQPTNGYSIADNNFLMILGNTGLVGLILLLLLISYVCKTYESVLQTNKSPFLKSYFVFLLLMIYGSLTINVIEAFPSQVFIYLSLILPFCYLPYECSASTQCPDTIASLPVK